MHSASARTADFMDIDHKPNIPNIDSELDGPEFGDWDEVFQGSSGECWSSANLRHVLLLSRNNLMYREPVVNA